MLKSISPRIVFVIIIAGVLIVALYILFGPAWLRPVIPVFISLLVAAIFSIGPLMACFAQTISLDRQSTKLETVVINERITKTQYYRLAKANLDFVRPASLAQNDFLTPMILFTSVILFCSLISFMGLLLPNAFGGMVPLLGGLYTLGKEVHDIEVYQQGTLIVAVTAFFGAYLALFSRLLNQLNNNDVYPITFYYHSLWLITAMVLAATMRNFASVFNLNDSAVLIAIAFAIGAAPAPFFTAFVHWAFNKLNIVGDKPDPKTDEMPTNLNLLMIDGLANDKIDRLAELEISDAQILACQNPFSIWVRTPYDLALIVDWISQAQLYVCLREGGFSKARAQGVGDIHKFVEALSDSRSCQDLCEQIGFKTSFVAPTLAGLRHNPCFVRLAEVKSAMLPEITQPVLTAGVNGESVVEFPRAAP